MDTKEAVKEFKNENGGIIKYTIKELLGAINIKIDKMDEDLGF